MWNVAASSKRAARPGISVRAYADHRRANNLPGANKSAVQKALRDKRIAYIGGDARNGIDAAAADAAWESNTNPAKRNEASSIAARESVAARAENGVAKAEPREAVPDFLESRARREYYDAELRGLELAERLGQLVPAEVSARLFQTVASNIRQQLLMMPGRTAPLLASAVADALEGVAEVPNLAQPLEAVLVEAVYEVLAVLHNRPAGDALEALVQDDSKQGGD